MTQSHVVLIDGVPYIPDPHHATRVRFWWIHDNHTFTRLEGKSVGQILAHMEEVKTPWGSLCSAILLHGDEEVRRVGLSVYNNPSCPEKWGADLSAWRDAIEADPDIRRILEAK